jgi:serine/threonine protein kinase
MFLDEARLVARIRHPNVVQTLDVVVEQVAETAAELFIVVEYVHGESLAPLLAVDVLRGLHEAHDARSETGEPLGVVHRGVSIHNVLVGVDGTTRILDFGVTDAIAAHIVSGPLRPPSALRQEVPTDLDPIVLRALARRPEDRYPTAKAMAEALETALDLATPQEIGTCVATSCQTSLEARARSIATIEHRHRGCAFRLRSTACVAYRVADRPCCRPFSASRRRSPSRARSLHFSCPRCRSRW